MDLLIPDISYKSNCIIHVWLLSLNGFKILRVVARIRTPYGWIIFVCVCTVHSVHYLDIWVLFTSWLWMRLLCTFFYNLVCVHTFSVFLGMYLRVELLDGDSFYSCLVQASIYLHVINWVNHIQILYILTAYSVN